MANPSNNITCGQTTGITTSAIPANQGSTTPSGSDVLIQSKNANTVNVLVGDATNQFIELTPGQTVTISVNSISKVYVKAASGTVGINWLIRE